MTDRIKTLVLYATGSAHWAPIAIDTLLRGVLKLSDEDLAPSSPLPKRLASRSLQTRFHYQNLSYVQDWQDAFVRAPQLDIDTLNTINLVDFARARRKIKDYDLIVVLHSAVGDKFNFLRRVEGWFQDRRGKLLVLPGNEYTLMPDKIGFLRAVEADFVGSQLPLDAAAWLYAECQPTRLLAAPHALNPRVYYPDPAATRSIDIGFVGDIHPFFVGDLERTQTVRYFQEQSAALGLSCDIRTRRIAREDWARFLNGCRGIIGAESGTYFLERSDRTRNAVQEYLREHPGASFEEIHERFFQHYPHPRSGKAISSRHFEPIGTLTCQILLEGRYNDILQPDEHYLALKKDYSNIDDVVGRFKDDGYRRAMVTRTRDYVLGNHTYRHRVDSLIRDIFGSAGLR